MGGEGADDPATASVARRVEENAAYCAPRLRQSRSQRYTIRCSNHESASSFRPRVNERRPYEARRWLAKVIYN